MISYDMERRVGDVEDLNSKFSKNELENPTLNLRILVSAVCSCFKHLHELYVVQKLEMFIDDNFNGTIHWIKP